MQTLPARPSELAKELAISVPYASQLLSGARKWPRLMAIKIFRERGVRVGELIDATDTEIDVLERFESPQAEAA
jgi:F420-0:gamma-glutamyl ligase-like protein